MKIRFLFYTVIILISLAISIFIYMKNKQYSLMIANIPETIPSYLKQISVIKKIPPEKDWLIAVTYENKNKQQVFFHFEPHRNIRCGQDPWKKDLLVFQPKNASVGCSFSMDHMINSKKVTLRWYLWNVGNNTYHIYDQESVMTNQEALDIANSIRQKPVIIQDFTK